MPAEEKPEPKDNLPATLDMSAYPVLQFEKEQLQDMLTALRENLGGQTITDRDLPLITVPSQGMEVWQVPGTQKAEYQPTIQGIIIHASTPRAYWARKLEDSGRTPPDCSSPDGITGTVHGPCFSCSFNAWGSDPESNGKACKERRLLFMLTEGNLLPTVVQVPPTSIEAIKRYAINLASKAKPQWTVITDLALVKVEADPFPYSRIVPTSAGDVPKDLLPRVEQYRSDIRPLLGPANYLPEQTQQPPADQSEQQDDRTLEDKIIDMYPVDQAQETEQQGEPADQQQEQEELPDPFTEDQQTA